MINNPNQTAPSELDAVSETRTSSVSGWSFPVKLFERSVASDSLSRSCASFINSRMSAFHSVQSIVQFMGRVPVGHPLHIDPLLSQKALNFIGVLTHNSEVEVPKLLPTDNDTLVLYWANMGVERLLTITVDEIDLVERDRAKDLKCVHELGQEDFLDLSQVFATLNFPVGGATQPETANA